MTLMKTLLGAAATLALTSGATLAEPAIIFDLGGKFDKSFNEAAFNGAERWAEETGGTFKELEMQSEAQREQALRRLAESGANPIVMTGFAFGDVLNQVAPDFPDTKFAIIDMVVDQPNVKSVVFTEHEGSYLVGMMAGHGVEDRHRRLHRRHGHSADPPLRLRLCAGREGGEPGCDGDPEHDRHHACRLERPGEGCRTGQGRRRRRART